MTIFPVRLSYRRRYVTSLVFAALAVQGAAPAQARRQPEPWTGTWAAAPCAPPAADSRTPLVFHDETLRLVVHTSVGGDAVRIRLSNTFSAEPVTVGAANLALRGEGSTVRAGAALRFSGRAGVAIPAGASVLSDPVPMAVPSLADVAVSLYLPGESHPGAVHYDTRQTNYAAPGDQAAAATLQGGHTLDRWPLLTAVDVSGTAPRAAIVALGSSTTDGAHSTANANHRWTDYFAARLQAAPGLRNRGVLNEGIGGNRVLHDGRGPSGPAFGPSASARFDRDVLSQAGVRYVVLFEGGNDINHPGDVAPISEAITADDLIAGYRQIIARAHEHGLRVVVATITPFEGSLKHADLQPAHEDVRQAVNRWVLSNTEADGSIDFARAVADPVHPARFLPLFDSGDHLHPNDAGYKAMADTIDLALFSR